MPDEPTDRELDCLRLTVERGSVRLAAVALELAESTVRNHLAACREKFRVHTTAQAFGVAVQRGLIDPFDLVFPRAA